jgi:radical SAM protein with 4Fe4S-binding SPASM domain
VTIERIVSAPAKVSIDVTHRCNLRCLHCRVDDRRTGTDALSGPDIIRVIDELAASGVFVVGLSGGEPFVRDDFMMILEHAARCPIPKVYVSTNATRLGDDLADRLARLPEKVVFRISLDGLAATHDQIRGVKGVFERTVLGIRVLISRNRRVEVTTTLMRPNLADAVGLARLCSDLGVARHRFISLMPVGHAGPEVMLSREEEQRLFDTLTPGESGRISVEIPFLERSPRGFTCRAGRWECAVLADGTIVGCKLMSDLVEGNILRDSLIETWRRADAFMPFRNGVDELDGMCRGCRRADTCRGGCRAYARAMSGKFYARDPRCAEPAFVA